MPLKGARGATVGYVCVAKDIRDIKELIAKIEEGRNDASYTLAKRLFETLDSEQRKRTGQSDAPISDIMSKDILSAEPSTPLSEIAKQMRERSISQVPVLENGRCVGSISAKTFASLAAEGKSAGRLKAGDVMGDAFPELPPSTMRSVAASVLRTNQAVLVVRKGKIEGILTSDDML